MTNRTLEDKLRSNLKTGLLINEPMAKHTSWQIGGPAQYFIEPEDIEDLQKCILLAKEYGVPLTVVGNGTNLLVKDSGIPGMVVKIGKGFNYLQVEGTTVKAGAGSMLPVVARGVMEKGLAGFAWSAGIPGTIGGAVVMNAGANGSCIGDIIQSVKVIDSSAEILDLTKRQLGFDYRTSILQGSSLVVVEAVFNCHHSDRKIIKEQMDKYMAKRKAVQPQGFPNAGSVFKNPPGDSAGRLIDLAGCKGLRVGKAEVSTVHANWIINLGGATANDVIKLIDIIKEKVKNKTGVALQLEVRVLG
ncbi:UDP-N-acetylmuramate dehydrogenase [Desulfohalotomaculum tongense]|uniref:UDP-N-acetylmuramate dehydrogenase n=1 Tax=Desulforadius tongensis TaxID=1216062 RepID=UPI0019566EB9|nr:UDP-N-acetylmuramate dehydrogenase [Desulforadius tongensis]MBM7855941.1 UDP-N-acetylmuramate dehydrogenase [Desulforadius tongensis]